MPRYAYKAVRPSGEVFEGVMDGVDRMAVIERLRSQGNIPIRAAERRRAEARWAVPTLGSKARRASAREIIMLTQELATLLAAGIALDRALTIIAKLQQSATVGTLVRGIQEQVRGGSTLADALTASDGVFPGFYIGMVRAGEAGGSLETVLARLADILERSQRVRDDIRSALRYPMVVLLVAAVAVVVLMTAVIPEFQPLFEDAGAALPFSTQIIIGVSDFMRAFWWVLALVAGIAFIGLRHYRSRPAGRAWWDRLVLGLPLLGDLIRKVEVARFARTLGALLGNGVNITSALSMTASTLSNQQVALAVSEAEARVKKGERLADTLLAAGVFPPLSVQLIEVGEESGELESMLSRVADLFDEQVGQTIQRILTLLVPGITIGLGILVAGIIGSILSAILSAYELPF